MPWYSYREAQRRFPDLHLVDTPRLDNIVESLASLQRYGMSVRQRRILGRYYAMQINRRLHEIKPDVVVAVGAMHKMTFVTDEYPIIHVTDGLFATMIGYYEKYGRFRQSVLREGHDDHQRVIDRAEMVLFASDWARDSAFSLYDIEMARTRVVPFGANLDHEPAFVPRRREGPLRILFVGYDWKRKGGNIVLETWRELRTRMPDTELHIVGCTPREASGVEGVTTYGRLDKSKPGDLARLEHCFAQASIFFMPSRQEAFGMAFCEAAAYGLPAISNITGGIPTVIGDDVTGLLLPIGSEPLQFADAIHALWMDAKRYEAMCVAARERYDNRLNWHAWGAGLEAAIDEVTNCL